MRSFVKFQTVLGLGIGAICGFLYAVGGLVVDALVSAGWMTCDETPGLSWGTVLAFGALVGIPIICGAFGAMLGLVEALVYRLYARWFGGLEMDVDE